MFQLNPPLSYEKSKAFVHELQIEAILLKLNRKKNSQLIFFLEITSNLAHAKPRHSL